MDDVSVYQQGLYFATLTSRYDRFADIKLHTTHLHCLSLSRYPVPTVLAAIPQEISALAVNEKAYVLVSQG